MQVAASRAKDFNSTCVRADSRQGLETEINMKLRFRTYLLSDRVEPVTDICTSGEHNRVALWTRIVPIDKLCKVVNLVEQGDPDVTSCIVRSHFLWRIEAPQFVRCWDISVILGPGWSRLTRSGDPSSHLVDCQLSLNLN